MLNIAVVGAAGRMGRRLVALIAEDPELTLTGATEVAASPLLGRDAGEVAGVGTLGVAITADPAAAFAGAAAVINFSTGGIAFATGLAVAAGAACVIGTTALAAEEKEAVRQLAVARGGRIVLAPNMSVGVNLLFHLVGEAARILGDDFDLEVVEMHHNQKKDAPSGTAVRLAEILCAARGLDYANDLRHGREGMVGARTRAEIGMHALRGGSVVGDHTVIFASEGERLELTHKAASRDTFAAGALRAAKFLSAAEPGLYDMQDVLGLRR